MPTQTTSAVPCTSAVGSQGGTTTNTTTTVAQDMMELLRAVEEDHPEYFTPSNEDCSVISSAGDATAVRRSLENIENNITSLRDRMDRKSPKVTMVQIDQKIDKVLDILQRNGLT